MGLAASLFGEYLMMPPRLHLPSLLFTVSMATEGADRGPFTCPGGLFS